MILKNVESMKTAISRLKKIKLLALDVDGVLTDCRVFLGSDGEWKRFFCIRDGYGIVQLKRYGYKVAIITASKAKDIKARAVDLKIDYLHDGNLDKLSELKKLIETSGLKADEIAYMGDDLFDIPVLQNVGFAATVPEAVDEVFHSVHYTTKRSGGEGAVREVCDLILKYGAMTSGTKTT
jgi:3-deoxy-D-manno-octulosonate 8-phosphate phosphatase (KDO 8-P phosphatase)